MVRIDLILGFVALALFIFCLVDVISIYDSRIKTLNKIAWVFIIILVPLIGPILWLVAGKERGGDRPAERARNARPVAPDDDLEFLRKVDVQESQEARIRRLEAELKRLNDDKPEQ
jgi:hypothetical protein